MITVLTISKNYGVTMITYYVRLIQHSHFFFDFLNDCEEYKASKMLRGFFGSSDKKAKKKKNDNDNSTCPASSPTTTSGIKTPDYSTSSSIDGSRSELHPVAFSLLADKTQRKPFRQ